MAKLPPLRAVMVFEAAARNSSFKIAADEIGVTPSAISHNISALERFLGVQLFERTARSVILTNDGYKYATLIGGITRQINWATDEMVRQSKIEVITIQSLPTIATTWLLDKIEEYLGRYPDIDIRLRTNFTPSSGFDDDTDMVVTYAETPSRGLVECNLHAERILPLVAPGYWDNLVGENAIAKLRNARLIHSDRSLISWTRWQELSGIDLPESHRGPRFDRGHLALQLAKSGCGVALESSIFAAGARRKGELVAPLPDSSVDVEGKSHKLLLREGFQQVPRLKNLVEFLISVAQESDGF